MADGHDDKRSLVEELRELSLYPDGLPARAADRIEELEREVANRAHFEEGYRKQIAALRAAPSANRDSIVEECAKVVENTPTTLCHNGDFFSERCARAIRALKNAAAQGRIEVETPASPGAPASAAPAIRQSNLDDVAKPAVWVDERFDDGLSKNGWVCAYLSKPYAKAIPLYRAPSSIAPSETGTEPHIIAARAKAFMENRPIYDAALAAAGAVATALRKNGVRICDCGSAPQGICCCGSAASARQGSEQSGTTTKGNP